jgi:TatD DNase family protein
MAKISLTDTHCHIHETVYDMPGDDGVRNKWLTDGKPDPDKMIADAKNVGVDKLICVGTSADDSHLAVNFVADRSNTWASIGIHPHESEAQLKLDAKVLDDFSGLASSSKVVAIGECGLDYFYTHSSKDDQLKMLRFQIELAKAHNLPLIFHVRDAFNDFWPIFDSYQGLRGVIHSFSAGTKELDQIVSRNLYVGLNGIMTFTKKAEQLEAARAVPKGKILLETDAPFLTPVPFRGNICEPKHVRLTAEFLAHLRDETLEELAANSTRNANELFNLS